jgi:diguanylate cyclase (GGDEF)-like protein
MATDTTGQREIGELRRALAASEARFFLLCQVTRELIWRWDAVRDRLVWSSRPDLVEAWSLREVAGRDDLLARVHPEDLPALEASWRRHLDDDTPTFEAEVRLHHPDLGWRWIRAQGLVSRRLDGTPTGALGTFTDVHGRRSAEDRAARATRYDELTGLLNRPATLALLEERLGGEAPAFWLMLADIEGFREINRTLGPGEADVVLRTFAERLGGLVGAEDVVGRVGADQLVVVRPAEERVHVEALAHAISDLLRTPVEVEGAPLLLDVHVGVVEVDGGWRSAHALLRDAEHALARARERSARYLVFDDVSLPRGRPSRSLASRLREAVENEDLRLVYQPIVALPGREVVAVEALLRWDDPERGPIGPGLFVPVAEETGLILPIGRWVLARACAALSRWTARAPGLALEMNVNVSPVQFGRGDVVADLRDALERFPEARGRLNVELTETALLERPADQAEVLQAIRRLGCRIHIDDFGTGYSSLSNLVTLDVDALKIDRVFVSQAEVDPRSRAVVQAVGRMATELGLSVTAEGIETEHQARLVSALGPCRGQGYLFARPMEEEDLVALLDGPAEALRRAG